jgi:hypothetical protein
MMRVLLRTFCLLLLTIAAPATAQSPLPGMLDVAQLARFRPVTVGMFSSYDRTGNNDDGFSGKHSFLRKEGDALVIAELTGPGALTRIWTPTPIDAPIEFYIDGERRPRIAMPFDQLFSGAQAPFTGPLVGRGAGGYWSYVPIEFARSVKVLVRAPKLQFYQLNYALYSPGTRLRSTRAPPSPRLQTSQEGRTVTSQAVLAPGRSVTLFETGRPGRITSLRLGPAAAFAGDLRDIDLRISWDGAARPAVDMPVAEFFAYSFGDPATRSLLLGTEGDTNYVHLPMPFSRSAKVELVSRRTAGAPLPIRAELTVDDRGRTADEAYFHARWNRETRARRGVPFPLLDVSGRGHLVGFTLQVQGATPGDTGFFEGDDVVTIDGRRAILGTGTEDAFNGGWYGLPGRWNERLSLPLSGALDYSRQLARTGGYRLLVGDAYSFNRRLNFTVEHGPERNEAEGDYAGAVFFYLDRPEGLPSAQVERRVIRADRFRIGTNPAAGLDTLIDASLTPQGKELPSGWVSTLRFVRTGGADKVVFDDTWGPPLVSFRVEAPQTGRYGIFVDALTGPAAAKLQLRDSNFQPVASPADFYAAAEGRSGFVKLGEFDLSAGINLLHLTMPERNPASRGAEVAIIDIEGRLLRAP